MAKRDWTFKAITPLGGTRALQCATFSTTPYWLGPPHANSLLLTACPLWASKLLLPTLVEYPLDVCEVHILSNLQFTPETELHLSLFKITGFREFLPQRTGEGQGAGLKAAAQAQPLLWFWGEGQIKVSKQGVGTVGCGNYLFTCLSALYTELLQGKMYACLAGSLQNARSKLSVNAD